MLDFPRFPGGTEGDGRGADLADAVHSGDELGAVGEHHRHAVAALQTTFEKVIGERVGIGVEVGERPLIVCGADADSVSELLGGPFEALVHHDESARSRSTSFMTLPVAFIGSSSTTTTVRGTL